MRGGQQKRQDSGELLRDEVSQSVSSLVSESLRKRIEGDWNDLQWLHLSISYPILYLTYASLVSTCPPSFALFHAHCARMS